MDYQLIQLSTNKFQGIKAFILVSYKSNALQNQMPAYGILSGSIDIAMRKKGGGDGASPSERGKKGQGNVIYCLWNMIELVWGGSEAFIIHQCLCQVHYF